MAQMISTTQHEEKTMGDDKAKIYLVRTYASGVHAGEIAARDGREVTLRNARRLWRWHTGGAGISLSEVSQTGINRSKSRICVTVPEMVILDALELIPMSDAAAESVVGAEVYKP